MNQEEYEKLWYDSVSPTVWCGRYAHPLHRVCMVVLNYEDLPEPFYGLAHELEHEGKTGDKIQVGPKTCFQCDRNIINAGECDPL